MQGVLAEGYGMGMAYTFCNSCGHRNPPEAVFCSSCGTVLDHPSERTIVLAKVDPLQDAPGDQDNVQVLLSEICGFHAAVKVLFVEGREVLFCDLHAFVNSENIWENAQAIYDRSDILPPKP